MGGLIHAGGPVVQRHGIAHLPQYIELELEYVQRTLLQSPRVEALQSDGETNSTSRRAKLTRL